MIKKTIILILFSFITHHHANAQTYQRISREQANNYAINKSSSNYLSNFNPKFYIGFDYSNNKLEYGGDGMFISDFCLPDSGYVVNLYTDEFKDKSSSYAFILGSKLNNYFGTEIFYQQSSNIESSLNSDFMNINNSNLEYQSYGIDFLAFMPLHRYLDYIVSLGIANYEIKGKYELSNSNAVGKISENISSNTFGYRLGTGFGINITNDLSLRLMAKFIKMQKSDIIDRMFEYSLGFRYIL